VRAVPCKSRAVADFVRRFDILGDVFLKSVYVVFNQGEQTVGVAQRDD
jgi:hypothetical protein